MKNNTCSRGFLSCLVLRWGATTSLNRDTWEDFYDSLLFKISRKRFLLPARLKIVLFLSNVAPCSAKIFIKSENQYFVIKGNFVGNFIKKIRNVFDHEDHRQCNMSGEYFYQIFCCSDLVNVWVQESFGSNLS